MAAGLRRLQSPAVLGCALLAAVAAPAPAAAHPHVWIEARAVLRYEGGRPVSVRNAWTFDPAYSAFLVLGAPRGADGRIDPAALAESARKAVASTAESNYFTEVRGAAGRMALGRPSGEAMSWDGERATLSFDLPLANRYPEPPDAPREARLEVMDPSYFVAFSFAPGDAVAIEGAPDGCAVEVKRPKGFSGEDAAALAAGVMTALSGGDAAERIGNAATVRCPPP